MADQAGRDGRRKIGVLGTDWTMKGPIYESAFGRAGIDWSIPDDADRQAIHEIIFDGLCLGIFTDVSRSRFLKVIRKLAANGCDAVALVCTEIPLLVTPDVSPLPTLDSTRLLARAAVDVAWAAHRCRRGVAGP